MRVKLISDVFEEEGIPAGTIGTVIEHTPDRPFPYRVSYDVPAAADPEARKTEGVLHYADELEILD